MTSLLTIISVMLLISVCWLMAKYNKSDDLFWILLISLFAGMAGGALANKLDGKSSSETKTNFTQVYNPTQVSPATSVDFCTLPGDALAILANPASKVTEILAYVSKVSFIALSDVFGEIRGQPVKVQNFYPHSRGTPEMPFDTS